MKEINIEHQGYIYTILREGSESNDVFLKRAWFIAFKVPTTKQMFEYYTNLSFIWRNHTFYNLEYPTSIQKLIQ